jgi:hypothetical protein
MESMLLNQPVRQQQFCLLGWGRLAAHVDGCGRRGFRDVPEPTFVLLVGSGNTCTGTVLGQMSFSALLVQA